MQRRSPREDRHDYLHDQLLLSLSLNQKRQLRKTKWSKTRKRTKKARQRPRSPQSQTPTRRTTLRTEKPRATRWRRLLKKPRRKQNLSSTTATTPLPQPPALSFCLSQPPHPFLLCPKTLLVSCCCPSSRHIVNRGIFLSMIL